MDFTSLDSIKEIEKKRAKINSIISKKNYSGSSDDKSWSITDIITQFYRSTCAQMASTHINGDDSKGKKIKLNILESIDVKIKVLSRQACSFDSKGKELNRNPLTNEFVLYTEQPKDGDVVRVKRGALVVNEATEKIYTKQEIDNMRMMDLPTYKYEDYTVKGGCIAVTGTDAMHLLSTKGKRIVVPKHKKPHSKFIKDPTLGKERRITNWLFEEVSNVAELTAGEKAAITRKANAEAKKLAEQDNDN